MLLEAQLARHAYYPDAPPPKGARVLDRIGRAVLYELFGGMRRALSVRGSSSALDWFQNARAIPLHKCGLNVHAGHSAMVEKLYREHPASYWRTLLGDSPLIVGHSAGGSVGLGLALRLKLPTVTIVTFGQPRFATGGIMAALGEGATYIRVVNGSDAVPRLPAPLLFRHEGQLLYLSNDGQLFADPSWFFRLRDRIAHMGSEYATDHFGDGYVEAIRRIYGA